MFKFPHLTPGYCGLTVENMTLNSMFYSSVFESLDCDKRIIFPQRAPTTEFFNELITLENKKESEKLSLKIKSIIDLLSEDGMFSDVHKLNVLNLSIRYSLYNEVLKSKFTFYEIENEIESRLIKIIAKSQISLENEDMINTDGLQRLIDDIADNKVSDRLSLLIHYNDPRNLDHQNQKI